MREKVRLLTKLFPAYFLIGLLVFFSAYSYLKNRQESQLLANWLVKEVSRGSEIEAKAQPVSGWPKLVAIPRLGIRAEVTQGDYFEENQAWNVSSTQAHFATVSALANNQAGKTVIYGHNTQAIFGKTSQLVSGDKLYLLTDNDLVFTYLYVGDEVVDPDETEIFDGQDGQPPQLTLITCSGLLNQKRRLMKFELTSISQ